MSEEERYELARSALMGNLYVGGDPVTLKDIRDNLKWLGGSLMKLFRLSSGDATTMAVTPPEKGSNKSASNAPKI